MNTSLQLLKETECQESNEHIIEEDERQFSEMTHSFQWLAVVKGMGLHKSQPVFCTHATFASSYPLKHRWLDLCQ